MPEHSPKYMFGYNQSVSMADLIPMEILVRLSRSNEEFQSLKADLRENGQKIAVKARPHPNQQLRNLGKLELLDGMGRYEALTELGEAEIRADVEDLTDEQAYKMAFNLNVNRENLNDLSIANWLDYVKRKFVMNNLEISEWTGRTPSWVSRHLAMIKTQEEIVSYQGTLGFEPIAAPQELTERQARAFRAAPEPLKLDFAKQLALGQETPSARELERRARAEFTPEQVFAKYSSPGITDEFLEYMLQEDAGLTVTEAKDAVRDFRTPKRSASGTKLSDKPNVWTKLSQYYPTEIIDVVGNLTGSENFETLIKYCRRYSQKLYLRAPESLRQAVLEEWQ